MLLSSEVTERGYDRHPSVDWTLGAATTVTPACIPWARYQSCLSIDVSLSAATTAAPAWMQNMGTVTTVTLCDQSPMPSRKAQPHAAVFEIR